MEVDTADKSKRMKVHILMTVITLGDLLCSNYFTFKGHFIVPTFFFGGVRYPLINLTIDFTCFDPGHLCDFNEL